MNSLVASGNASSGNASSGNASRIATSISLGYVCPFMDELVDSLYTEELNALIDKTCQTGLDKRTFMMFIMMYFFTYINVSGPSGGVSKPEERKVMLKVFMSELIMNSEKRRRCVELYMLFEKSVEKSVTTLDICMQ